MINAKKREKKIQGISVATDEGPSPKLSKSRGKGNMEIQLRVWFELDYPNHLAMNWASWSLHPVDH